MNFRRMVKCWVSDTLTTIHGLTNDDCKNAIDEISENISPMEIMMGGEGSGHRWGDLRSTQGTGGDVCTQMMKHHCCCVLLLIAVVVVVAKILLLFLLVLCLHQKTFIWCGHWSCWWKQKKRWKKEALDANEEAAAASCIKCLQEIWGTL